MVQVYTGSNQYALKEAVKTRLSSFIAENGDLSVESFDAEDADLQDIRSALQSVSLFTPSKLVVVRDLSVNKNAADELDDLISNDSDRADLLIVESRPDKRSNYYKKLKSNTELVEFDQLNPNQLAAWVVSSVGQFGGNINSSDAHYLIQRVGDDQLNLAQEIKKLTSYSPEVTRKTIDLLTVANPQNTVFELLEAAFSGQLSKSLKPYDNLRQNGSQPQIILSMLVWQIHQVNLVTYSDGRSAETIASDSGYKPYPIKKSQTIARKLGIREASRLVDRLDKLDYRLKTESVDADEALKNFISEVAIS